jgi:hypothetical protein
MNKVIVNYYTTYKHFEVVKNELDEKLRENETQKKAHHAALQKLNVIFFYLTKLKHKRSLKKDL